MKLEYDENGKFRKKDRLESKSGKFKEWLNSLKDFVLYWKDREEKKVENETIATSEILKWNVVDSALDGLDLDVQKSIESQDTDLEVMSQLNDLVKNWKNKINRSNKQLLSEGEIDSRSEWVKEWLIESEDHVLSDMKNWDKEPNLIARWLYKLAYAINNTKKD